MALLITIGLYLLISILLYWFQRYFFYHPEKLPKDFQFRFSGNFEEIIIPAKEGDVIDALNFRAPQSKGVVLYFKGNTRSIKGWSKFRYDFTEADYDFFIFDYPGFGKSTGRPTEESIFDDTCAVYERVREMYPEEKIVIYGRSLGSGFAVRVASLYHPKLLILDSPFYNLKELADYYSWILPLKWILRLHVPLNEYIKDVKCLIVIFHGNKDKIIPYRFSERLKKEFPDKIDLRTIEGGKHNDLPTFKEYHKQLKEVLQSFKR